MQSENIEIGYRRNKTMEKIIKKTQSLNVREQHSKYKVLFHNSINIRRQCDIVCVSVGYK